MTLSLIVPALDEAEQIEACLAWLKREHDGEILVADGGSRDGTPDFAARAGARVIAPGRGLAKQVNAAVAQAKGEEIFVVAADGRPAEGWKLAVEDALADPSVLGGGLRLHLEGATWGLKIIEWGGNVRAHYLGVTLPDQGLFVRRRAFLDCGGLPEDSLIPYIPFSHRLSERGGFRLLSHEMGSSIRKWRRHGVLRTTLGHWRTYLRFKYG